jgi:hypothetical protein
MAGWEHPNRVRSKLADERAQRFAAYLAVADTLKEAAWLARMPERTARRYRARLR